MSTGNEIWENRPEKLKDTELVAWALTEVAAAIRKHYYWMGTADAGTPMGATEVLGNAIKDGCSIIGEALDNVADNVACTDFMGIVRSVNAVAEAIAGHGTGEE